MNLKRLGKMQKDILKLLSVKGANIKMVHDLRDMKKDFWVNYDKNMKGGDCGDCLTVSEQFFDNLVMREGLFQQYHTPSSLEADVQAYELTPEAKQYFQSLKP